MYTIYHIPGVKIGCTEQRPNERVTDQGYKDFEVLEYHEDIYIASNREIELQKQYGLPVDIVPYYKTRERFTPEILERAGKNGGDKVKNEKLGICGLTKQQRQKTGSISGKKHVESGHWRKLHLDKRATTFEMAQKIREDHKLTQLGPRALSRKYKLPYSTVRGILVRRTYLTPENE